MRELILSEIRRLAAANEGKPPGQTAFHTLTGIPEHKWRGVHWARWGDALADAGFAPIKWTERLPSDELLSKIAEISLSLRRLPTTSELEILRREDSSVPNPKTLRSHFGGQDGLLDALRQLATTVEKFSELNKILPAPRKLPSSREPAKSDGYVYLIKMGDDYTIGRSDNIERRMKEYKRQLPRPHVLFHVITTDDPPGIEAYWLARFASSKTHGDWFALSASDLKAFQRRKFQ